MIDSQRHVGDKGDGHARAASGADGDEPRHALMDVRCFILMAVTVGVGVLLYVKPAAGLAILGAVTLLATLVRLVGR